MRVAALGAVGAAAVTAVAAGIAAGRSLHDRWGVDPDESARRLPGDDLVDQADAVDTRVIDIDAPVDKVWPWLVQMGYGRGGWYSYDVLDMNEPSALDIEARWQSLAVGDVMPTHPGGGFVVKVLDAPTTLVLYIDRAIVEQQEREAKEPRDDRPSGVDAATSNVRATGAYLGQAVQGDFAASWAFVLKPGAHDGTRLVERFRVRMEAPAKAQPFMRVARACLGFGVFVMTRRQMLGIKDRAEGRFGAPKRSFPIHPGTSAETQAVSSAETQAGSSAEHLAVV
ncbi:MAG: hypothetical protein R3C32_09400 [Chloroflexota bacterium]